MSAEASRIEDTAEASAENRRTEALGEAWRAAMKALYALIVMLMTLVLRAMQAVFVLARPALLVGCVVAPFYGAASLYPTLFRLYGADIPAALVAALAVVTIPAALLILADRYDVFAIALASGAVMIGAKEAAIRSPPVILAMVWPVVIGACFLHYERKGDRNEEIGIR